MLVMSTEAKTALLAQFARVAKALGNPARLELLDLLIQAERSVDDLARAAGMPVGNTSAQLRALHAAGLVASAGGRRPPPPGAPPPPPPPAGGSDGGARAAGPPPTRPRECPKGASPPGPWGPGAPAAVRPRVI